MFILGLLAMHRSLRASALRMVTEDGHSLPVKACHVRSRLQPELSAPY